MTKQKEPEFLRVQMKKTIKKELSKGSFVSYQAGELYLLPKEQADKFIKEGAAIDPNAKKPKEKGVK